MSPTPAAQHVNENIIVDKDLCHCSHVFLGDATVQKPLQLPKIGFSIIVKKINDYLLIIFINLTYQPSLLMSVKIKMMADAFEASCKICPEESGRLVNLMLPNYNLE